MASPLAWPDSLILFGAGRMGQVMLEAWLKEGAPGKGIYVGATYNISFTWLPLVEALHLACAFEVNMPSQRQPALSTLLSLINEQLWIGHFGRGGPGVIVFRHSLVLSGGISPSVSQCECLLKAAVNSCERYYQAFQIILWSEESAQNALHWTTIETKGEA